MENSKVTKKFTSYGTQFSSTDIYYEEEEPISGNKTEKVLIPFEKDE